MKPRVLLLTHRVPHPPDRGDRIRCWHLLQQLAAHADVSLAAMADEPVAKETSNTLADLCEQTCLTRVARWHKVRGAITGIACGTSISQQAFACGKLARTIKRWHDQRTFDAIVVYCSSMYPYVRSWNDVPTLVDLIDVDSAKWKSYAEEAGVQTKWLFRREAQMVARLERQIIDSSAEVVVTTSREAELLREGSPHADPLVVTNGVDIQYFKSSQPWQPARIVFTGVLNYRPNVQGILTFVQEVWPRLRERFPKMTLDIVGRSPVSAISSLHGQAGISVSPNVPDVRPHLSAAEIVIAPLNMARGIQNKALEAMAMQRPVIASPAVAAGLSATSGEHFLTAKTANDWIEQIARLHSNGDLRQSIATKARTFVETHHDWSKCLRPTVDWLERVTGSGNLIPTRAMSLTAT